MEKSPYIFILRYKTWKIGHWFPPYCKIGIDNLEKLLKFRKDPELHPIGQVDRSCEIQTFGTTGITGKKLRSQQGKQRLPGGEKAGFEGMLHGRNLRPISQDL